MKLAEEAQRMLRNADRDRKAFRILIASKEADEITICFHAQQAVEKYLKAVLIRLGVNYRKTHDLLELATLIKDQGLELPYSPEELSLLNPYAVTFRYEEEEIMTVTVKEAKRLVIGMRQWAVKQLLI
jgi:HEPN domain-containing protein